MRAREISGGSGSEDEPTQPIQNPGLEELQNKVALNSVQLLELVSNDQKFMQRIIQYNAIGVEFIAKDDYERGLVYLQEAQKILEYAASCGKTIDRFLIISTLHNEACVYQKLWELEKSSDYMEAIIYNMSTYIDQGPPFVFTSEFHNHSSEGYQNLSAYVYRRLTTAVYHLQYSAVSSQIGKHDLAIGSTKSCLKLLNEILAQQCSYQSFITQKNNRNSKMRQLFYKSQGIDKKIVQNFVTDNRNLLKKLKANETIEDNTGAKLKKFSIGQVMQIDPISSEKANQIIPIDNLISSLGFIQMSLYVSIAYYAIATEMRLIFNNHSDPFVKRQQMERSKIYHLNAIRIAIQFVPYVTDYLQHIVKSLKNNYQIDLNADEAGSDQWIDPDLIVNTSFMIKTEESITEKQLDSSHKTEVKKIPSEVFGQTFTIHKKISDFGNQETNARTKKSRTKKGHSISTNAKHREKHSLSKDLKVSKNLKTINMRKDEQGASRKVSHKNIMHKAKKQKQKQKIKTGNSHEKTKDQTKKVQQKGKTKKKLHDEYMGTTGQSKDMKKRKDRKSQSNNKIFKSSSRDKQDFLSPRGGKITRIKHF